MSPRLAALAPALVLLACAGAATKPAGSADASLVEARRLVAEAKADYDAGRFAQAADLYEQVYRLKPVPELLFNIGQAARYTHDLPRAERAYQAYLLLGKPPEPLRGQVEKAVATLRVALADGVDPLIAILELRGPAPAVAPQTREGARPVTPDGSYLTNVVRTLAADRGLNVMTRENVEVLLASRHATVADCVDKCEVEVARVLGADYVISGELLRTSDGAFHASLQLHEAATARFLAGAQASGANVAEVESELRAGVGSLFDRVREQAAARSRGASR